MLCIPVTITLSLEIVVKEETVDMIICSVLTLVPIFIQDRSEKRTHDTTINIYTHLSPEKLRNNDLLLLKV